MHIRCLTNTACSRSIRIIADSDNVAACDKCAASHRDAERHDCLSATGDTEGAPVSRGGDGGAGPLSQKGAPMGADAV